MVVHTPVLLHEVCWLLAPESKLIVDCTLGHGWHAMQLLTLAKNATLIGIDVDELMMDKAKNIIENWKLKIENRIQYVRGNYADIQTIVWGKKADFILNDLWVNLEHFKAVERGFSIRGDAPLDMRFDTQQSLTAAKILATYTQDQLTTIFETYADFSTSKARELAHAIISTRKEHPLLTTQDFKTVLNSCGLGYKACIVIFQSLRIEVNGEMDNLKRFLAAFPKVLNLAWRCLVINYHSIEDRLVKQAFNELVVTGKYHLVTKKPIVPNYKEVALNRAARSAKLRVIELNK